MFKGKGPLSGGSKSGTKFFFRKPACPLEPNGLRKIMAEITKKIFRKPKKRKKILGEKGGDSGISSVYETKISWFLLLGLRRQCSSAYQQASAKNWATLESFTTELSGALL